jgi:hypothetical protein
MLQWEALFHFFVCLSLSLSGQEEESLLASSERGIFLSSSSAPGFILGFFLLLHTSLTMSLTGEVPLLPPLTAVAEVLFLSSEDAVVVRTAAVAGSCTWTMRLRVLVACRRREGTRLDFSAHY